MKVIDAITQLQSVKPNQYDEEMLVRWLSDLDGLIYNEIVKWHENSNDIPHGPYAPDGGLDDVLLVPEPYSDLYIKYLAAQVDYWNGEFGRYNNSMAMYNTDLSSFADWYNRNNMPLQDYSVIVR